MQGLKRKIYEEITLDPQDCIVIIILADTYIQLHIRCESTFVSDFMVRMTQDEVYQE